MGFSQDRVQQRLGPSVMSRSLTIHFLRGGGGLQGFLLEQNSTAAGVGRSLVEVLKVFAQDRVPHRVDFFTTRMKEFKIVFRTFPRSKKKRGGNPPVECESAR